MPDNLHAPLVERLRGVVDPELGADIVSLGMVTSATLDAHGTAVIGVALTTVACPLRGRLERDVRSCLAGPVLEADQIVWD